MRRRRMWVKGCGGRVFCGHHQPQQTESGRQKGVVLPGTEAPANALKARPPKACGIGRGGGTALSLAAPATVPSPVAPRRRWTRRVPQRAAVPIAPRDGGTLHPQVVLVLGSPAGHPSYGRNTSGCRCRAGGKLTHSCPCAPGSRSAAPSTHCSQGPHERPRLTIPSPRRSRSPPRSRRLAMVGEFKRE
jgi:hypothetical protein